MKKTLIFLVSLVLLTLLASFASADIGITTDTTTVHEFDYQELRDDNEELTKTITLTFENSGSDNESDITFSLSSSQSELSVDFSSSDDSTQNITAGDTTSFDIIVTADLSSGFDQDLYEDVITVEWTDSTGTNTASLDVEVLSIIDIEDGYLYINDNLEESVDSDDTDDSSTDMEISPEDEISFYFNIVNLFDEDYDNGDIEGTITVTMDDDEFGDEIEEDVDFDIDPDAETGDNDNKISFKVPLEAEEGEYEFVVLFETEDGNGAEYETEWTITLELVREDDDVKITDYEFGTNVKCNEAPRFTVDVTNYGNDDQNDMSVELSSTDLSIDDSITFDINEGTDKGDNEDSFDFYLSIPEIESNEYTLQVDLYYKDGELADREVVAFDLTCDSYDNSQSTTDDSSTSDSGDNSDSGSSTQVIVLDSDNDNQDNESETVVTGDDRVVTVEKSYTIEDAQTGLAVVLAVLLVLVLAALLLIGLRRR